MAVYTRVDKAALDAFLLGYDLGKAGKLEEIPAGVSNTNYHLFTASGRFILTLFEDRVQREDIPYFLAFSNHLRSKGVPCPRVIPDRAGKSSGTLCGRPAAITEFLQGSSVSPPTAEHCAAAGEMLARMHLAGEDFSLRRENAMGLSAWKSLIGACEAGATESVETGLFSFLQEELSYQQGRLQDLQELPRGAVHADLFPDNVFFQKTTLTGVIDFYFSCDDFYAYDLMLTFNPWCFGKDGTLRMADSRAFLESYMKIRPLSPREQELLPLFGRMAALRIVATRLYDLLHRKEGATVSVHDPLEHVRILRFHRNAAGPETYGAPA